MFWTTWPAYVVLGRSSWAFEAATALVNAAWLTLTVWLVKRRVGFGLTWWFGLVSLVLIAGYGLDGLSQPWNPWVALLPFGALIAAVWAGLEGERWAPVVAVAAASYSLQAHVGYLPVTVPLAGLAMAWPVIDWWRTRTKPGEQAERGLQSWLVPTVVAVAAGVVAWSGPVADILRHHPNNLDKLVANFSNPSDPPIGLARAVRVVLQASSPLGAWVHGGADVSGSLVPGALLLGAWVAVAILVTTRLRVASLNRLNFTLAVTSALGLVAISRVFGAIYLYTFRWIVVLVAFQIFSLGWGSWALFAYRREAQPPPDRASLATAPAFRLTAVALVLLALTSAVTSVHIVGQKIPYDQSWRSEATLAPEVARTLRHKRNYLIAWRDPAYLGGLGFGLLLDLDRRGFDVGALPQFDAAVEPHRIMCPGRVDQIVTVVTGENNIAQFARQPGQRRIASADPRSDVAQWRRYRADLLSVLRRQGHVYDEISLEQSLNLLLLAPGQTHQVTDLAAKLVLGGVPSAVFLDERPTAVQRAEAAAQADEQRTSHPCR